jgi:hypothetical protein
MNVRTELVLADGEAAIEGLDAIAQSVDTRHWLTACDRDLERQGAIGVLHADRCLGAE